MPAREKITMDGPTTQRPHAGVPNSTGHTPRVLSQAYKKINAQAYNYQNLQTMTPHRWLAHMALQSDLNNM